MRACEDFLIHLERMLPDLCCDKDLIANGLFRSPQGCWFARKSKQCPEFMKINGRVVYPKKGVIEWLRSIINASKAEKK